MLKPYVFRILLPLTIFWDSFLPEKEEEWIKYKFKYNNTYDVEAKIGIGKRSDHMEFFNGLPENLSNPDSNRKITFPTESIWLKFTIFWPNDVHEKLLDSINKKEITAYHETVKNIVREIYGKLIVIIRDIFGQYWINTNLLNDENLWNLVKWEETASHWKEIFPKSIYLTSRFSREGLNQEKWQEVSKNLSENKPINMIYTMLANAMNYLDSGKGRMAIVEAHCALEASLKQYVPGRLNKMSSQKISKAKFDKAIEKLGVTHSLEILFNFFSSSFNLDSKDIENCKQLIEKRNNIIHHKSRVNIEEAKEMVLSTASIVKKIMSL